MLPREWTWMCLVQCGAAGEWTQHRAGRFRIPHLRATAAAIAGLACQALVIHQIPPWYEVLEVSLDLTELADAYAELALRMAGSAQQT